MNDRDVSLTDDDRATILERCSVRIRYMRKMIDDLLDLTRIESGQKKRELSSVDLIKIVNLAVESVTPDTDARSISINIAGPPEMFIYADQSELEIVCNNLISNAVKYNRDQGTVTITIEKNDDVVRIAVSDTGIGLSDEEINRLFEDFVRIKNAKTRGIPGSGLGLSIVKKIAKLNGGDVRVESIPDEGSTFTVTLAC